jgi:hypothetical protein
MQAAITQAATAAAAAGPGGGSASSNAALARQLMPSWGSGAMWTAWNNVAMAESGWNQFARNPSSGAYGIPQALPPSKMGAAANPPESNPTAQIRWMISYIESVYGTPVGAWAHENSNHWYGKGGLVSFDSGGWLMPGLTMAVNNTGRPEQVTAGSKEDRGRLENVEKLLGQLIGATQANAPQANADALQKALDGVAKRSAYKGQYTTRRNVLRG